MIFSLRLMLSYGIYGVKKIAYWCISFEYFLRWEANQLVVNMTYLPKHVFFGVCLCHLGSNESTNDYFKSIYYSILNFQFNLAIGCSNLLNSDYHNKFYILINYLNKPIILIYLILLLYYSFLNKFYIS